MKNQEIRITLEGGSGCGKAALAFALSRSLREIGLTGIAMSAGITDAGKDPLVTAPEMDPEVLKWMNDTVAVSVDIRDTARASESGNQIFMTDTIRKLGEELETKRDELLKNLTIAYPEIVVNVLREECTAAQDHSQHTEEVMRKWWNNGNVIPADVQEAAKLRNVDIYRMGDHVVVVRDKQAIMVVIHPLGVDTKKYRLIKYEGIIRNWDMPSHNRSVRDDQLTDMIMNQIRQAIHDLPLSETAAKAAQAAKEKDLAQATAAAYEKYSPELFFVASSMVNAHVLGGRAFTMSLDKGGVTWEVKSADGTHFAPIALSLRITLDQSSKDIESAWFGISIGSDGFDTVSAFDIAVPRGFIQGFEPRTTPSFDMCFNTKNLGEVATRLKHLLD